MALAAALLSRVHVIQGLKAHVATSAHGRTENIAKQIRLGERGRWKGR